MPQIDLDNIIPYVPCAQRPPVPMRLSSGPRPPIFHGAISEPTLPLSSKQAWSSNTASAANPIASDASLFFPILPEAMVRRPFPEAVNTSLASTSDQSTNCLISAVAKARRYADCEMPSNLCDQQLPRNQMDHFKTPAALSSLPPDNAQGSGFPASDKVQSPSPCSTVEWDCVADRLSQKLPSILDRSLSAVGEGHESNGLLIEKSDSCTPPTPETDTHPSPVLSVIENNQSIAVSRSCAVDIDTFARENENPCCEEQSSSDQDVDTNSTFVLDQNETEQQTSEENSRHNSSSERPYSPQEIIANHSSAPERPSVVIITRGPQTRPKETTSLSHSPSTKRTRSPVAYDSNTTNGCLDPTDEAFTRDVQCASRQSKRAKAAKKAGPQRGRQSSRQTQRKEQPFGLHDIETIPVRGFLTRQILFSNVVYSVTFEEQATHGHLENSSKRHLAHRQERSPRRNHHSNSHPVISLSDEDKLLVDLKERQGLSWKEITKRFPGRSQGSLQVRYCTRLKKRDENGHLRSSGGSNKRSHIPLSSITSYPQTSSRQRYGPCRRRRPVDRYSPPC